MPETSAEKDFRKAQEAWDKAYKDLTEGSQSDVPKNQKAMTRARKNLDEARKKVEEERGKPKWWNTDLAPHDPKDVSIDKQRGYFHFKEPVGRLADVSVPVLSMTRLIPGDVVAYFSHRDRPEFDGNPDAPDALGKRRFVYRAELKSGKAVKVKEFTKGVIPTPVFERELQLIFAGKTGQQTNGFLLEAFAEERAKTLLEDKEDSVEGQELIAVGFLDARTNGFVTGVTFSCDGKIALTTIKAGSSMKGASLLPKDLFAMSDEIAFGMAPVIAQGVRERQAQLKSPSRLGPRSLIDDQRRLT